MPRDEASSPEAFPATKCTACLSDESVVGPLGLNPRYPQCCAYCTAGLAQVDGLMDEVAPVLRPWIKACNARGVEPSNVVDTVTLVVEQLMKEIHYKRLHLLDQVG